MSTWIDCDGDVSGLLVEGAICLELVVSVGCGELGAPAFANEKERR